MRVILKKLNVENCLCWGRLSLDLSAKGLVLVHGPNGGGKSSILDILKYLFFGSTTKGQRGKSVINRTAKKGMLIELTLLREESGKLVEYRVIEGAGHKTHKSDFKILRGKSDTPINPVKQKIASRKQAAALLGLSEKEFLGAVYLRQGGVHPLIDGTDASRIQYQTESFGLEEFDTLRDRFSARAKEVEKLLAELNAVSARKAAFDEQLKDMGSPKQARKKIKALHSAAQHHKDELSGLDLAIRDALRRAEKQRRRERLETKIDFDVATTQKTEAKAREAAERFSKQAESAAAELELAQRRVKLENRLKSLGKRGDLTHAQDDLKSLRKLASRYPEAKERFNDASRVDDALARVGKVPKDFSKSAAKQRMQSLFALRADLKGSLRRSDELAGKSVCPMCGQDCKHIVKASDEKGDRRKLSKVEAELTELGEQIEARQRQQELQQRRKALNPPTAKKLKLMKAATKDVRDAEKRVDALEERARLEAELAKLTNRTPHEVRKELEDARRKAEKSRADAEYCKNQQAMAEEVANLPRGKHTTTEKKLRKLESARNNTRGAMEKVSYEKAQLDTMVRQHAELTHKSEKCSKKLADLPKVEWEATALEHLVRAYSNSGLKRERVRGIFKTLEQLLPMHTQSLLPNYRFSLKADDKSCSFVYEDLRTGAVDDVQTLSGGEKKRLSVALILSERMLRAVKPNVLFLDEFDAGLDKQGREEMVRILAQFRRTYGTILVITQAEDLIDNPEFDTNWRVRSDKKGSVLRTTDPKSAGSLIL